MSKHDAPTETAGAEHPADAEPRDWLNAEDLGVLRRWREALILQDPRLENKGILKLVVLAMTSDEFRNRLVNDTEAVVADFVARGLPLPEDLTLKFYDNSRDTVHIVLPPRAGSMRNRPPALREVLRSGTAAYSISDDFDHGNISGDTDHGDHTAFDGGHHY